MNVFMMLLISYFSGALFGVIETWSKKAMFFVWLASIILMIITIADGSNPYNVQADYGISNWWWFAFIPAVMIGYYHGVKFYNEVFK